MVSASEIIKRAEELGYDKCGIVPLYKMAAYGDKLRQRIECFPETAGRYAKLFDFSYPQKKYPWAKSVIICSYWYGKYRIPESLRGHIARYYLTDGRRQKYSEGYKTSVAFEQYLCNMGLKIAFDRDFGITSLRWAAQKAGLGIIRKNNFFYTEKGSYQHLEAFLIDEPLEHSYKNTLKPCPDKCRLCIQACPTHSLCTPYSMNRNTCVSDLTTWSGWEMWNEPLHEHLGDWIYGCDACQDSCPHNRKAWMEIEEYPGLQAIGSKFSLPWIVESDYEYLEQVIQPILWYIPPEKSWRYKTNALNAMLNHFRPEYYPAIQKACNDEKEPVRQMAQWVLQQLNTDEPRPLCPAHCTREKLLTRIKHSEGGPQNA